MPDTTQFGGIEADGPNEGSLKANTILMARYRILGVLGGGGMGTVYQARDLNFPDTKRLVAVKEMQNPATDPSLRASTLKTFRREANILAMLAHPAIPRIYDFFDQNDRVYLIMEYIHGSDLENIIGKTKELPVDKIVEWAIDLCDVLSYLHGQQPEPVIFRDMKPANIMIDSLGKVRLIDFGIAKTIQPVRPDGSKIVHTMIGTEGYSAPEQYKGNVTPLSDIYSLGATLHHVITRKDPRLEPPFSFNERPIKEYNDKAPQGLIEIVERSLAFEPHARFQSCLEMKEALEQLRYRPVMIQAVPAAANGGDANKAPGATNFFDDLTATGEVQARWKFSTEDEIRGSATAFKDLAFVGSYDTNVWAIKLEDGEFKWKFPTNGGIASSPVIDEANKLVLFGSEDYTFRAVDYQSGRINWSYTTRGKIRGTPRAAHGHVFFGSDDGRLYALVAGNGRYLWEYDMGAEVRSRPFVTNELVIVGCESGEVVALELAGARKWAFRARRNVTCSPVVDMVEGVCYVGAYDGFMYALDASSGYSLWRFRTGGPIISSPAIEGNLIYFGSGDGNFYAVNGESGRDKWSFSTGKAIVSSPVVHQGAIYFGGTDGFLYCVDATNGKERWKFKTNGPITGTPFIIGDKILIGSVDKTLYALPLVGLS
jgi:eukaryotic-like serine/threonine-protein kinase